MLYWLMLMYQMTQSKGGHSLPILGLELTKNMYCDLEILRNKVILQQLCGLSKSGDSALPINRPGVKYIQRIRD